MASAEDTPELDKTTMAPIDMFGHFLLPLTMNKGHIDAKTADYIRMVRGRFLEDKKDRPERHALRNLLGMLSFRQTHFEEAMEYMDKILSPGEDPDNLNALANRKYMCEKLFMFQEARKCKQRIYELVTCDETQESQDRCKRLRARSLAEQAFAYSFELFEESVTVDRYRKSVELYEQATDLAGDLIDLDEKEDWITVCTMACHKIYNHSRNKKLPQSEVKYWYQEAVKNAMLLVQNSKDKQLLGDSWRHLGELFQEPYDLRPTIPYDMKIHADDPGLCFKEALEAQPKDARILARYAKHLQRTCKYKQALEMVSESIAVDESQYNFFAYTARAGFRISEFIRKLRMYQKYQNSCPNVNLLLDAEQDLKIALELSCTPWLLRSMAEVYYYKGLNISDGDGKVGKDGKKSIQLALMYCAKAAACRDGMKSPDVHKVRGDCLCAIDDHEAALGSFKRALECARPFPNSTKYGKHIVDEFAHVLKETESLTENPSMLADMLYWLHGIAEDHIYNKWTLRNLWKLKRFRNHWTAFAEYCKNNNSEGKLATIEKAANDTDPENTETSFQTKPVVHSLQSFPGSGKDQLTTVEPEEPQVEANIVIDLESDAPKHTGDKLSDLSQITGSPIPAAAAMKREETSVIQFIYEVNLETGKTRQFFTQPSTETTDEVSTRSVRDAPKLPLNRLNMKYDFFVIYSDSAAEWVEHCMLEELEGTGLKGCIKDRDFTPGKAELCNYSNRIKNSVCTIIVITKDFEPIKLEESRIKNAYTCTAMLMAMRISNVVIPVLREDRDLPEVIKHLTHLDAIGGVDWGRLIRSIEQGIKLEATSDE